MDRTSIDETETDKTYKVLLDLYNLLGENAVLLPVPLGAKTPTYKSWQKTKFKDTLEPSY